MQRGQLIQYVLSRGEGSSNDNLFPFLHKKKTKYSFELSFSIFCLLTVSVFLTLKDKIIIEDLDSIVQTVMLSL